MKIIWDDDKRRTNIQKHGFDFADAATLLDSLTYTFEDARFAYGERRFITMGILRETVVVIAHTETARQIRIFPCARRPNMSKPSISKTSRRAATSETDWRRVHAMGNADIDLSDIPEITAEMAAHGVVRVAGKAVPRGKQRLTMYLDTAIVEYFKARAGTRGYQTLINTALRQAIEHESLENTLRRVIREERAAYRVTPARRGK